MNKIFLLIAVFFSTNVLAQKTNFVITAFGAKGDSTTVNTIAIQNAIDEAAKAGGGKVIITKGKFVTGVIYLKSGVELQLQKDAFLFGSTNRLDYGTGSASALIVADRQQHIAITGQGTIDGRGYEVVKSLVPQLANGTIEDKQWRSKAPEERNRPKIITFIECRDIKIKGITIKNGASWIQEYRRCNKIVIDKVTVLSNEYWNNDGIDINNSKNVSITNCDINVADDAICIKSEGEVVDSCENIYVAHCKLRSSANAFKIGTGSRGGFRNIKVRDLTIYDTYRSAIAIETVDGAFLENVDIKNINAKNTGNAIFIRLGHRNKDTVYSSAKNIRIENVYVQIPAGKPDKGYNMEGPLLKYPPTFKPVTGLVQSVSPWNNSSKDSTAVPYLHNVFPSSITGLPNHQVQNVSIKNIEIVYETIADKTVNYLPLNSFRIITEAEKDYPEFSMFGELPVWGFYARHVIGLTMKKITVKMKGKDFRTAFLFNEVKKLVVEKIKAEGDTMKPDIFYNEVEK
ncbi:glycoside hydrolase family 28 protein [Ferruginibacter sp. SUN106]|uniref:glycoside hydrolase family 28 protein n=1 Tax=Ferruginibacter sp. SUN106 TaxID=2978348 RepID=UPI003D3636B3